MMSMSYPARTAFFCSSIFILSRSVILRLTSRIAVNPGQSRRMCRDTTRLDSIARKSARHRSFRSEARIGEETDLLCFSFRLIPEGALVAEVKARLKIRSPWWDSPEGRKPFPVEEERRLRIHVEHVMHELEPFPACQAGRAATPSRLKLFSKSISMRSSLGFAAYDALGFNAEGDGTRSWSGRYCPWPAGFAACPHTQCRISSLPSSRSGIRMLCSEDLFTGREIEKRELQVNAVVKVIEEIAPALKDGGLVIVLGQLIVDVLKADGLGVVLIW